MKRIHTHYENLKVARNAPPEVIRAAYKSLSKMHHPDRNPDNPDSARIMSIINTSYEVLSDPKKRRQHDEWIKSQEQDYSPQPVNSKPSPETNYSPDFELPKSGNFVFDDLPDKVKENLKKRVNGDIETQIAVKTGGIAWNYVWTIVLFGWFVYLLSDAAEYRWNDESTLWMPILTAIATVLLSINLNRIVRWNSSPLHCWLIVSPLYVIKTELDRVWYWPIWSISDISGTHNYQNGAYQDTSLKVSFEGKPISFTITPEPAYTQLISTLQSFDTKFRTAVANGDMNYVILNDDFAECHSMPSNAGQRKIATKVAYVFISTFALSAIIYSAAYIYNSERPYKPLNFRPNVASNIPYTSTQQTPRTSYIRPTAAPNGQPWPASADYVSGYKKLHTDGLSSVTVDNTRNNSDVFVKLVHIGQAKAFPVRTFFIPASSRFTIRKISEGNYDIRYRDLVSGALTRSESFRLEEISTQNGVEYSNITMTLYKIKNGNMQTYPISEDEF